ncbi:SHOCT domain-containing protein [Desulfosporosinus nitroreducens]|uniref:SHOCT domain-containing protein n=1 Tax=Desulfosporosinus nitroreducens TaxID=2018668 RepID=A0ABT8QS15_9FIRM|nr:SHOCT domain-containing protein [Desulfosporosinus nitroreducens]MCO1602528.1 SHOCT domain-containing protein [Desulfosporosinus nitroreducens]MDO0824139.1 SHOCT domain-containing protein [Desulfosporosinus nitroreducens]
MAGKVRVRPSKSQSLTGMIGGAVFVFIGFSLIELIGTFSLMFTIMGLVIGGLHAYNFFSNRGMTSWEIEEDPIHATAYRERDFETSLRKLNKLKEDGLISENEFEKKRIEIMKSEWYG